MRTLREGPELRSGFADGWASLLSLPPVRGPTHLPVSVLWAQPLQVAKLTLQIWGYPHAETPTIEVRGRLAWLLNVPPLCIWGGFLSGGASSWDP